MNKKVRFFGILLHLSMFLVTSSCVYASELPYVKVGIRKIKDKNSDMVNSTAIYTIVLQSAEVGDAPALFASQVRTNPFKDIQKYLLFDQNRGFRFSTEQIKEDKNHKSLEELKKLIDGFDQANTQAFDGIRAYMANHSSITGINLSSTNGQIKDALKGALEKFEKYVSDAFINNCGSEETVGKDSLSSSGISVGISKHIENEDEVLDGLYGFVEKQILPKILNADTRRTLETNFKKQADLVEAQHDSLVKYLDGMKKKFEDEAAKLIMVRFYYTPPLDLSKTSKYIDPYRDLYREIQRLGKFFGFECPKLEKYSSISWIGLVSTIGLGALAYGLVKYFSGRTAECSPVPVAKPAPAPVAPAFTRTPLTLKPSTQLPPRPGQ